MLFKEKRDSIISHRLRGNPGARPSERAGQRGFRAGVLSVGRSRVFRTLNDGKKNAQTFVNRYELHTDDLQIKRFERDEDWFHYIFSNRRRLPDALQTFDVIIGPIANDALFNTFGILTSGMLGDAVAMALLQLGPAYTQVVLKTERAKEALRFLGAATLDHDTLAANKMRLAAEEAAFQTLFSETMQRLLGDE